MLTISAMGQLPSFSDYPGISAFGGKADIEFAAQEVRLYEALSVKAVLIQLS